MTVQEIKKLINQLNTRVMVEKAPLLSPRGQVLKYTLVEGAGRTVLVAFGVHGNVMIPEAQRDIWTMFDGNGKKIDLNWADFNDVFGMLGQKHLVQQRAAESMRQH